MKKYRYVFSPNYALRFDPSSGFTEEKLIKVLNTLTNSPRQAQKAHSLKSLLDKIWSAHFKTRTGAFYTILYFICDNSLNSCLGGGSNVYKKCCDPLPCPHPSSQILIFMIDKGESCYNNLSSYFA